MTPGMTRREERDCSGSHTRCLQEGRGVAVRERSDAETLGRRRGPLARGPAAHCSQAWIRPIG